MLLLLLSKSPQSMILRCSADGVIQPGRLNSVSLLMARKNHYNMIFGPSDDSGKVAVASDDIIDEVKYAVEMSPMDYDDLDGFTGDILVAPLDCRQIESALRAFDLYHNVSPYPADYRNRLVRAWETLYRLTPKRLDVELISYVATPRVKIITNSIVPSYPVHPLP